MSQKVKSTKAKMAKNAPTPEELAQRQKSNLPGVRMGKIRAWHTRGTQRVSGRADLSSVMHTGVEKGDSGGQSEL